MTKWDYLVVRFAVNQVAVSRFEAKLAEAGQDGWELVAILRESEKSSASGIGWCLLTFKRPTEEVRASGE